VSAGGMPGVTLIFAPAGSDKTTPIKASEPGILCITGATWCQITRPADRQVLFSCRVEICGVCLVPSKGEVRCTRNNPSRAIGRLSIRIVEVL
jgi:hypothetical protein